MFKEMLNLFGILAILTKGYFRKGFFSEILDFKCFFSTGEPGPC